MRPVSDRFLTTIRGSHRIVIRVRVITDFQTGVNPSGGVELQVIDGDVQLDSTNDVRSTIDVTVFSDDHSFTREPDGLLTPYGNTLFVERGVTYGNGVSEYVSLGYFRIYEVEQDHRTIDPVRIAGRDRMSGLVDARSIGDRPFPAGTSFRQLFETLVGEVYPEAQIEYDFNPDSDTLNATNTMEDQQTYYNFLLDLVKSRSKIFYWDHRGVLVIKTAPDPEATVFDVNMGSNGVLVSLSRRVHREGVYNAVAARGEAPDDDPPVMGVARDMNPLSATFWNGQFGKVPRFYASSFLRSNLQAANAAEAILRRSIGRPYEVDFSMVPNVALEPLDPIKITREDGFENHVIERLRVPLDVETAMTGSTRELTDVFIETEEVD